MIIDCSKKSLTPSYAKTIPLSFSHVVTLATILSTIAAHGGKKDTTKLDKRV
jgi:hypothetical protein